MLPEVCQIWCLSTWPLGILVPVPQRQGTRGEFIIKELFALGRRQGKTLFFKARHRNRIELACIPWLPCNKMAFCQDVECNRSRHVGTKIATEKIGANLLVTTLGITRQFRLFHPQNGADIMK